MTDWFEYKAKTNVDDIDWQYGYFVDTITGKYLIPHGCDETYIDLHDYEIAAETLCKSIGIKDRNGNTIYTGDIVEYTYHTKDMYNGYKVRGCVHIDRNNGAPIFVPNRTCKHLTMSQRRKKNYQVIGNIWDSWSCDLLDEEPDNSQTEVIQKVRYVKELAREQGLDEREFIIATAPTCRKARLE